MNKTITLILVLLFSCNFISRAQCVLENPGFEEWESTPFENYCIGWDTPNALGTALGVDSQSVFQESVNVADGMYAAKLKNQFILIPLIGAEIDVPGVITTGTIGLDIATMAPSVTGGFACDTRYNYLCGQYQYIPQNGDTAVFNIQFYKDMEVIGEANQFVTEGNTTYEPFSLEVEWLNDLAPDTCLITFATSNSSNEIFAGSLLYLDDFELQFDACIVGIEEENENLTNNYLFYPTIVQDNLIVEVSIGLESQVQIYDLNGRIIHESLLHSGMNQIKMTNAESGIYFYSVFEGENRVKSGKILVD